MGIRDVHAAAMITGVSAQAKLVLMFMASHTRDESEPGSIDAHVYWGGQMVLASLLGYTEPGEEPSQTAMRQVRKWIKELVAAGWLKPVRPASRGRTAAYSLDLPARRRLSTGKG